MKNSASKKRGHLFGEITLSEENKYAKKKILFDQYSFRGSGDLDYSQEKRIEFLGYHSIKFSHHEQGSLILFYTVLCIVRL